MSRSLYEWKDAYNQYLKEKFNVNQIHEPVLYERETTNQFWYNRRSEAIERLPTNLSFATQKNDIAPLLAQIAADEATKEDRFLDKFFPNHTSLNKIDAFNQLFQGQEHYERLLKRLHYVMNTYKKRTMAPNLEALYATYLQTALGSNEELIKFRQILIEAVKNGESLETYRPQFDQIIRDTMIQALNNMTQAEAGLIYGGGEDWKEISRILGTLQPNYLQDEFIKNIQNAIGIERFNNLFTTISKPTFRNTKQIISQTLGLKSRTYSIGGNVIENTYVALAEAIINANTKDMQFEFGGAAVSGQKVKTDFVFSLGYNATMTARGLNDALSAHTGPIIDAQATLDKFYNEQIQAQKELYTVFVNSKNYTMGVNARSEYVETVSGNLEELPIFLSRNGFPVGAAESFIRLISSTGKGAMRYGQRRQIQKTLTNALAAAAARIMFDDYTTIGQGTADNNIHMYLISGIYVPASIIYKAMSEAANNKVTSSAKVTMPGPINDVYKRTGSYGTGTNFEIKQKIYQRWEEESEQVRKTVEWEVNFKIRLKQILQAHINKQKI